MSGNQPKEERRLNPITRALAVIAGAEPDMLAKCPVRDIHNVLTIACLLLIVWVWQSVLFTMVGHMMLASPRNARIAVAAHCARLELGLRLMVAPPPRRRHGRHRHRSR